MSKLKRHIWHQNGLDPLCEEGLRFDIYREMTNDYKKTTCKRCLKLLGVSQKVNKWKLVKEFFNLKTSNKYFTRREYFEYFKNKKIDITSLDTYRNVLQRAGFIAILEPGLYKKMRPIPEKLSFQQALKICSDPTNPFWFARRKKCASVRA